jgi:hypothetical protein
MRGADQTEVPLVDQVGERDSVMLVLLRHGDDETEIRAYQSIDGKRISASRPAREIRLIGRFEERERPDLAKVGGE